MADYTIEGKKFRKFDCIECDCAFLMPEALAQRQLDYGGYHYCPNGHRQGWSKDQVTVEKLRRERDLLNQRLAEKDDAIKAARDEAAAAKKATEKIKRRALSGVCPCCNRTFSNVQKHMATKHKNVIPLALKA